jgi:hypothetical protein
MGKCNITDKELADALDITVDKLVDICEFFDSDPDDDWELVEGIHFERGPFGSKIFSPEGAVEVCNYLEQNKEERPLLKRWKRWLLQRDRKLKGLMISKRVQEISILGSSYLIYQSGKAFLAPRACREVLGLGKRQDILNRTFQELQRSENIEIEPLKINEDFLLEENDQRFLSRSGLAAVGKHLGVRLTQRHRQEWVKVVADYAPKALMTLEKYEADKEKRIKIAMDKVRKQANKRCEITNRKQAVYKFDLEVHHLFDKKSYPQVADMEVNLIAIASDIHAHFHQWMGGCNVSCTVEDMEKYIEEFSNALFPGGDAEQATKVAIRLSQSKSILRALLKQK